MSEIDNGTDHNAMEQPPSRKRVTTSEIRNMASPVKYGNRTPGPTKKGAIAIFDDQAVIEGYASVPLIELDLLPRGGLSFETKSVGRIQVSHALRLSSEYCCIQHANCFPY